MSQERKAALAPAIKSICKKYGIKASLGVHHHSTLILNIKSGPIDFIKNCNEIASQHPRYNEQKYQEQKDYLQVNHYWYHEHFSGKAKKFLEEVISAMNVGNHDNSDIQTDYFDVGWYISVNVGKWNKPYVIA